jgi:hypothetical protein
MLKLMQEPPAAEPTRSGDREGTPAALRGR